MTPVFADCDCNHKDVIFNKVALHDFDNINKAIEVLLSYQLMEERMEQLLHYCIHFNGRHIIAVV